MAYDSKEDTTNHVLRVRELLRLIANNLTERGYQHDLSKFEEPEKSAYDAATPKLKDTVYGSEEYRAALREIRPAIDHHYAKNRHHPEHFSNGIYGMTLLDLLEMLADWKASSERMKEGGSIVRSFEINKDRFDIDPKLYAILWQTAQELGWIQSS